MLHKLATTTAQRLRRHGSSHARYEQAVDRMVDAYVDWREEVIAARDAYSRCDMTRGPTARHAFAAYFAALEREGRAAAEYESCVERVCALGYSQGWPAVTSRAGSGSEPAPPRRPRERL